MDLLALILEFAAPVSPTRLSIQEGTRGYDPPDYTQVPSPADEEYARNLAAAREVAREMDTLQFAPPGPLPSPQQQPYRQSISLQPIQPLHVARSPSPLSPPMAPFAQPRSVSPNPTVGMPMPYPESPRSGPGVTPSPILSDSPYATPPEFPMSSTPPPSQSFPTHSTSGARTISAAAFKRTGRTGSDAELTKKRPLPASPYPVRTATSGLARGDSQDVGYAHSGQHSPGGQAPDIPPQREPDSPVMSDYGVLGNVRVTNTSGPASPGYGQSHFVTNLED